MASGFHLVFLVCLISGLTGRTRSDGVNVPVPGCPPGWTLLGSRCFIFQNRPMAMGNAESVCLALGGNLASVHSTEENLFLRELVRKESGSYVLFWNGCHDGVQEGKWMWTDGSRFDYEAWGVQEPNNAWGKEDCVEMNWTGHYWNDAQCHVHRPFVCAKDL